MATNDVTRLIVRTALRDRPAFDRLYQLTSAKLFGVCVRVLTDRSDAEEALQETFVKVWQNAERFAISELSPMSWLIAIARNSAIDRLRMRRAVPATLDAAAEVPDPGIDPEESAVAAGAAGHIDRCLDELPPQRAAAVRAAYLGGSSYKELAERLGIPLNTVRTWLRRSLLQLRECLER